MSATTDLIRERGVLGLESDIPHGVTLGEYRASQGAAPSRWEKLRAGILGVGLLGILAETILTQRTGR